jgi:hypothetical protein
MSTVLKEPPTPDSPRPSRSFLGSLASLVGTAAEALASYAAGLMRYTVGNAESNHRLLEFETAEKVYRINDNGRVLKRSLRPDEYRTLSNGEPLIPRLVVERLRNEAACIKFIQENTNIPVPKVLDTYEEDGSYYLWTEYINGVEMSELTDKERSKILPQSKRYLTISSSTIVTSVSSGHYYQVTKSSLEIIRRPNRNSLSPQRRIFLSPLYLETPILYRRRFRLLSL